MIFSLIAKLMLALIVPLALDEYYYFLWGQQISLSYFDHPPMTGWLMILAQKLRFLGEGAIRWPFILLSQGTLWIWYKILKDELKESYLFWFLIVGLVNPLWGLGALIANPDIPLLFFWSFSLLIVKRIIHSDEMRNYIYLGICLGFGFLSKYQIFLFLPSLFIMLEQQKLFKKFLTWKSLVAISTALFFCLPVLLWNQTHDWASFKFQWAHGMSAKYWRWYFPFDFILGQIALIFPTFLLFMSQKDRKWVNHWLLPFVFFPFLFFFYSSARSKVEANWLIMVYPMVYALAFLFMTNTVFLWAKRTVFLWGGALSAVLIMIPMKDSLGMQKVRLFDADKFQSILSSLDDQKHYFAFNYQLASYLSFHKNKLICKLPFYGRPDHFNYIKSCLHLPDHFFYIGETNYVPPFARDFPGYMLIAKHPINNQYVIYEVQKK